MKYGFIMLRFHGTLAAIRNNLPHASVNAIRKSLKKFADSSRIRKSLYKCERSIKLFNTLSANIASYRNESTDLPGQYWHLMG